MPKEVRELLLIPSARVQRCLAQTPTNCAYLPDCYQRNHRVEALGLAPHLVSSAWKRPRLYFKEYQLHGIFCCDLRHKTKVMLDLP